MIELQNAEFSFDPQYPFAFLSVREDEYGEQYIDVETNANSTEELAQVLLQGLVSTQKLLEED